MLLWRPRSILQLMLLGLFTVVAPLSIGFIYTVETLDELSDKHQAINEHTISLTRSSQFFDSSLLDLERRARQYVALGDADLLDLFVHEREQLLITLTQIDLTLAELAPAKSAAMRRIWTQLHRDLQAMPVSSRDIARSLSLFDSLSDGSSAFRERVQHYVDNELAELARYADDIQNSLVIMVALLAVLTLAFSLLLIYWINSPIKQIERQIKQLGSGDLQRKIRISGPAEMQLLGRQLEWLRTRLNELEQQKLQFLRHMSHELKTPLASLREGADLMAEGVAGELQTKQKEVVDIIQLNSRELQRLIENLLDYNQMLHNQQLQLQPVKLQKLWQGLLGTHQMTIERKQLKVHCRGSVSIWPVDEAKFRTVLDNLLSNAVSYTPAQGQIDINWHSEQQQLVMEVANSGIPIPETEQDKIFEPFYQGINSRNGPIKGSGIGLSVARECAVAHGGTLALAAHAQLAVCFRLVIPKEDL